MRCINDNQRAHKDVDGDWIKHELSPTTKNTLPNTIMSKNPHKGFDYEEAAKHLKHLLLQIATIRVNNKKDGIIYKGPEIKSSSILSVSGNIQDDFSRQGISNFSENGTKLDLFIMKVYQLGYSVGIEEEKERTEFMREMLLKKLDKHE